MTDKELMREVKLQETIDMLSVVTSSVSQDVCKDIECDDNEEDLQLVAATTVLKQCEECNIILDYDFFMNEEYSACRKTLKNAITTMYNKMVRFVNSSKEDKTAKLSYIKTVPVSIISEILKYSKDIRRAYIPGLVGGTPLLCVRIRDEEDARYGTYALQTDDTSDITKIIKNMNFKAGKNFVAEVISELEQSAPKISTYPKFDIFICNNGIYETDTNEFVEFDSQDFEDRYGQYAFLNKLTVNYNPDATLVTLKHDDGTSWNIESGIREAFDDQPDCDVKVRAFMQLMNHALRFNGDGHKWYFVNASKMCDGGGMKSTLIQLIANFMMSENICSSSIDELAEDFGLQPVVGKCAILADETDSDRDAIESCKDLKKLSRNEKCTIKRKHKDPLVYRFTAIMIQASNDIPRFKNANKSVFRTDSVLNFEKTFVSDGKKERKYIKDDYIARQEVLEYLLLKVIEMGVAEYDEEVLESCSPIKTGMMAASLPVYGFMDELVDLHPDAFIGWNAVPHKILFNMFHKWFEDTNNAKSGMQMKTFKMQLKSWIGEHKDEWGYTDEVFKMNMSCDTDSAHRLLLDFGMIEWLDVYGPSSTNVKLNAKALRTTNRGGVIRIASNSVFTNIAFASNNVITKAEMARSVSKAKAEAVDVTKDDVTVTA